MDEASETGETKHADHQGEDAAAAVSCCARAIALAHTAHAAPRESQVQSAQAQLHPAGQLHLH